MTDTNAPLELAQTILLDQWKHLSDELRNDILSEFNKGFTRIVPYKDGPFNRLGLSDGENTIFFSGEHTADFNALLNAAQNAYQATHFTSDTASNTRLLLADIIQDAQCAAHTAALKVIDKEVLDYLRYHLDRAFPVNEMASIDEFLKSDKLKNGVCDALRFSLGLRVLDQEEFGPLAKDNRMITEIISYLIENPQRAIDRIGSQVFDLLVKRDSARQKMKF